jgi:hypothetical protein
MKRHAAPHWHKAFAIDNSVMNGGALTPRSQNGQINELYKYVLIKF